MEKIELLDYRPLNEIYRHAGSVLQLMTAILGLKIPGMKWLLLFCFLPSLMASAQSQKELIKKYGIHKLTTVTLEEGYDDKTTVVYYDDKGNDTAIHTYGKRYQYSVIKYDSKNRMEKKEIFWNDGRPYMTYNFTYDKNGSYRADDEDAEFKMKSTTWYNAKGDVIKVKIPDGSVRTYGYDAKGNMIKLQIATPGKKIKTQTARHKFDSKGRILETVWSDGAKSTYKYDNRGLLLASTSESKGNDELAGYKDKTTYQYE